MNTDLLAALDADAIDALAHLTATLGAVEVVDVVETIAPSAPRYFVVFDGHTAAEGTWVYARCSSRHEAMNICDRENLHLGFGGTSRMHIERVD